MKSLRKSRTRLQISTPIPIPLPSAVPPQKVIRAVADLDDDEHLPFRKGDFFYVTGEQDLASPCYNAHNPVTGARGPVPKHLFDEFPARSTSSTPLKSRVFYAVVLHDFLAERPDELDAKAGDPISVVAQSNREWFVAKPIGKLGRPGLIPASFVQLRDPATNLAIHDVDALMDRGELPKVEDWKKAMINYKQSSIPLGVIDPDPPVPSPPVATPPPRPPSPVPLPDGILLSAEVVSFHYEMDVYWFRIDAVFQPYDPHDPHVLPNARQLVLFRPYNDFYDFQVNLLEAFPQEAGREPGSNRILPFMPGPADKVDDEVTAVRRVELDQYIRKLCDLNAVGASYILEHHLIRNFLSVKPGDVENEIDPRYDEITALFSDPVEQDPPGVARDFEEEVRDTLGEMKLSDRDDPSDGSDYGDDHTPPLQPAVHQPADALHSHFYQPSSPHRDRSNGYNLSRVSHGSSSTQWPDYTTSSPSSLRSSQPSLTSRSRSHSSAATNLSAPPVSAANPQISFVKIKIFDRVTDDLIAIRVHPKVTHSELMNKVQTRLGTSISTLRYRDSLRNEFVGLEGDHGLRDWLERAEKHVLYAD